MNSKFMFLGESVEFWMALRDRADSLQSTEILRELVAANAKILYYESHLRQMAQYGQFVDEKLKK